MQFGYFLGEFVKGNDCEANGIAVAHDSEKFGKSLHHSLHVVNCSSTLFVGVLFSTYSQVNFIYPS